MHYQLHYQFPRTCTVNFTISPYLQGHALSISQSVPVSKGIHCQFHNQSLSPRACTVNFTISPCLQGHALSIFTINSLGHVLSISQSVPISKGMHYKFHHQFPRTCTVNFTINPYLQGHAPWISLSIPKDMHCQFHSQSLSPRACTVNFTISPYLQGHALSISLSVP